MMRSHTLIVILLVAAVLTGCTKEPDARQPAPEVPGKTVMATFELTRDFEQAVEVKATGTENVSTIKDLWIIQMAPDGSALLQAPVYIPNGSVKAQGSDFRIQAELQNLPGKIVFVANTNSSSLYSSLSLASTEADVASKVKSVLNEGYICSPLGVPMSGVWSGTPAGGNVSGKVSMTRGCARVSLTLGADLPEGDRFELKSIQLRQVPRQIWYYRDDSAIPDYPFPALTKNSMIDYVAQTVTDVKFAGGGIHLIINRLCGIYLKIAEA